MQKIVLILLAVLALGIITLTSVEGAISVLFSVGLSFAVIMIISRAADDDPFPVTIFLIALFARLLLGLIIHYFELRNVFGPDAFLYDAAGQRLAEIWSGDAAGANKITNRAIMTVGTGWGMSYLVGAIYFVFGKSMLVAQSFCGVIGAATAPLVYFCAQRIFNNRRVSRFAAIGIAVFPAFIIWSSQILKDGLIIFLLVASMTAVMEIQKKFSGVAIGVLVACLIGILSLRFYIFYMAIVAIGCSFLIGLNTSVKSTIRNVAAVGLVGIALVYFGVIGNATQEFKTYGSLERVQLSRNDLVESASSGFGGDIDVSTPEGAISAIPVGMINLMLAPFPWQVKKWTQAVILPEMFLWWAMIPILISGLWYSVKNRLRSALPILLFVGMLTVAYSIFQGNIGMAYRQRTQIQVFLFIFIAVGAVLILEKRETKRILRLERNKSGMPTVTTNFN